MWQFRGQLIVALKNSGYAVEVLAPFDGGEAQFRGAGVPVRRLSMQSKGRNPIVDLGLLFVLWRIYRAYRPYRIFHYTIKPNVYGSVAAAFARVPSIAVVTGLGYAFVHKNWISRVARLLYRASLRLSSEVWFLNTTDRALLVEGGYIAAERTFVLPGEGLDMSVFAPRPRERSTADDVQCLRLLFIGRLIRDKGVYELVEAIQQLRAEGLRLQLDLLGPLDPDDPATVKPDDLRAWQVKGWVNHLGTTDDVRPYIAASDAVILPSYREGIPRALLEAAAMGRMVIATDVPGCREVVRPGETGLLAPPRSPVELANVIRRVSALTDNERDAFGQRGRLWVEKSFSMESVVKMYLKRLSQEAEAGATACGGERHGL
jgi:glycosyltransferase involved in cell wall biosynthesis